VGQLNFFRWAIEKEIIGHITEYRDEIEKDMNKTLKEHYSRSTKSTTSRVTEDTATFDAATIPSAVQGTPSSRGSRKKRCELTQSAMRKVNFHACDVTVSFN
jgi:hypothetical protein